MSKNIEVEVRSFIDDQQYVHTRNVLDRDFKFMREIDEITVYFSGEKDLRMRRSKEEACVILKEGKIHDDFRQEFEIRIDKMDFEDMTKLFQSLGYEIEIEWHGHRIEYKRGDIKALLDDTEGYGKILELEQMAEEGHEREVHDKLIYEINHLGVKELTSKEEFDYKFEYYKKNWKTLIKLG